jgi:monovalent cation:H+ antiporter-2, CPA2 family
MLAFGFAAADMGMAVDLLVILASAAIVILAFQRLKLALIPAYLITGALIGPHALRLGPAPELLQDISHLAIILLMFGIGLELHLDHLRHGLARMVTAGIGACLGVALAAWPLAIACGLASPSALAFTMADRKSVV